MYAIWALGGSMRQLSKMTDGLIGQPMFKLLSRVKELEDSGQRIFHFEIGDSNFRAHQHIIDATKAALDQDMTHYVDSSGIVELREAICDHCAETLGFRPDMEQVLVMPANGIIDSVLRCVADPGDDCLYPDPGFSTYIAVSNYTAINKVGYPLLDQNDFHADVQDMAMRITPRTRLLISNSPNNPTGAVASQEEIEQIYALGESRDLYLLSDEIYSQVLYEGAQHHSPAVFDQCRERTIILNGFAKNYSMPGWRLGYAIGPVEVIRKMGILFQTMFSCVPAFVQAAGVEALKGDQAPVRERIWRYEVLRNHIVEKLNSIPGISCVVPEGACYVFPNISGTGMSSAEFADFALDQAGVALLPGTCFGEYGEGHVRMCFTRSVDTIELACEKLKAAVMKRAGRYHEVFAG